MTFSNLFAVETVPASSPSVEELERFHVPLNMKATYCVSVVHYGDSEPTIYRNVPALVLKPFQLFLDGSLFCIWTERVDAFEIKYGKKKDSESDPKQSEMYHSQGHPVPFPKHNFDETRFKLAISKYKSKQLYGTFSLSHNEILFNCISLNHLTL